MPNQPKSLPLNHLLLAIGVVAIWGSNFVVIKNTLANLPPILFAFLRFATVFLPACFIFKKPSVALWQLASYGCFIGVGQFGLLYYAMVNNIAPGLASLIIQMQAVFTILLSMIWFKERVALFSIVAIGCASMGVVWIALHTDHHTTLLGITLVLCAALSWAMGNVINRMAMLGRGNINPLSFVVWSSAFACPILLIGSWYLEGRLNIQATLTNMDTKQWLAVLWQSWGNSIIGYGAWAWLLSRHKVSQIAPLSLLVPVFGMVSAVWFLNEPMPSWKLTGAVFIAAGLLLNTFGNRWFNR